MTLLTINAYGILLRYGDIDYQGLHDQFVASLAMVSRSKER